MSKLVIYENKDGGVSIISPAQGIDPKDAAAMLVPPKAAWKIIEPSDLPSSRVFRDAWTIDGVDVKKAKGIWLDKVRAVRDERLKELDVKWMRAMENGESKVANSIAAKKQILRDVTERKEIVKAKTLEDIENFWPEILER